MFEDDRFPCTNCLILPICKALYKDCMQTNPGRIFINEIEYKCSLITIYLGEYNDHNKPMKERFELIVPLYDFFYKGLTDEKT